MVKLNTNKFKKLLALMLAFALVLGAVPITATANAIDVTLEAYEGQESLVFSQYVTVTSPGALVVSGILPFDVVVDETALREAIGNAVGDATITIDTNITLSSTLTIPAGANITLAGAGALTANGDFDVIAVEEGATLTINGITITRQSGTLGRGIRNLGHLTMLDGVITGHNVVGGSGAGVNNWQAGTTFIMHGGTVTGNTATGSGGGVMNFNGHFIMWNGTISNNSSTEWHGGGVQNGGTTSVFDMHGGTISDNEAHLNGGGVMNWTTFNMHSGTISGNEATSDGGGVGNEGAFNLHDGEISNNDAANGGGVSNNGTLIMTNGIISHNKAETGGGVFIDANATFTMINGEISNNEASMIGGGVFILTTATFNWNGGTVSNNQALITSDNIHQAYNGILNVPNAQTFTITLSATGNGTLTATANGQTINSGDQVDVGTEITFTATPGNSMQWVDEWTINGVAVDGLGASALARNTITLIIEDDTIVTVTFRQRRDFTVTQTFYPANVATNPNLRALVEGTWTQIVRPRQIPGYTFDRWEVTLDASGTLQAALDAGTNVFDNAPNAAGGTGNYVYRFYMPSNPIVVVGIWTAQQSFTILATDLGWNAARGGGGGQYIQIAAPLDHPPTPNDRHEFWQRNPAASFASGGNIVFAVAAGERTGYLFGGWDVQGITLPPGHVTTQNILDLSGLAMPQNDVVVTPIWRRMLNVTVYLYEGAGPDQSLLANPGQFLPGWHVFLAIPTRIGHDFEGYRLYNLQGDILDIPLVRVQVEGSEGGVEYRFIMPDHDVRVVGLWTEITTTNRTPVIVTISVADKTFDGEPITATASAPGIPAGDITITWHDASGNLLPAAPADAGNYEVRASITGNSAITYVGETSEAFTISQRTVTVTAESFTITAGQAIPALTVTFDGFIDPDNAANALVTQPILQHNAPNNTTPGTFAISFQTPAALNNTNGANYTLNHVNGTLIVTAPVTQFTVTFNGNSGTPSHPFVLVDAGGVFSQYLPRATRPGWDFIGWNTMPNGTGTWFTRTTIVNANITVFAQWQWIGDGNGGNNDGNGWTPSTPTPTPTPTPPVIGRPEDEYPAEPDDVLGPRLLAAPAPGVRVPWVIPTQQPVPPAHQMFTDVSADAWYHEFVTSVVSHGIFTGMGGEIFAPQGTMTRAMFAQALANLQNVDISAFAGGTRFDDVAPDAWYNAAVEWAAYMGIVSGVENNRFDPSASITREQMATMLFNFMQVFEVELPLSQAIGFTDQDSISHWAEAAVVIMQQAGIISGRPGGVFDPQATATRAEVATIFARFLEVL